MRKPGDITGILAFPYRAAPDKGPLRRCIACRFLISIQPRTISSATHQTTK
jgi:hypothetical protein